MADVKRITSRHRAIMLDLCSGMKPCEASAKHDMTESYLCIIRRSPLWMAEEKAMREDFTEQKKTQIVGMMDKALKVVDDSMGSMDEKIALAAAKDTLNRGGVNHTEVIEGTGAQIRIVIND